jgi:hypothetical protein
MPFRCEQRYEEASSCERNPLLDMRISMNFLQELAKKSSSDDADYVS